MIVLHGTAALYSAPGLTCHITARGVGRMKVFEDDVGVASSREVPRREGRRTLDAISSGAVTRAARDGAIVAAVREGYPLTEIARYVALHVSTVSRIVSPPGARACKTPGYKT
jgi:hypothetical protein